MKTPCMDCKERHTACWGKCEKYQTWKAEKDAAKNKVEYERLKMKQIWKGGKP